MDSFQAAGSMLRKNGCRAGFPRVCVPTVCVEKAGIAPNRAIEDGVSTIPAIQITASLSSAISILPGRKLSEVDSVAKHSRFRRIQREQFSIRLTILQFLLHNLTTCVARIIVAGTIPAQSGVSDAVHGDDFMKRLLASLSLLVLVSITPSAVSAQSSQTDPRVGTWKLNVEKSKGTTRKSETRTYTQSGDSVTGHVEAVNADGSKQVYEVTGKTDGKDNPWSGQGPGGADTVSMKRVGNALVADDKKDGKVIFKTTITFSADGKVMTLRSKGVDANGKPFNPVTVYDKQ